MAANDDRSPPSDDEALDREAILARRKTLLRRSLVALGAVAIAAVDACTPTPCLSPLPPDGGDASADVSDAAAITEDVADASPMPCLAPIQEDASSD